MGQGCMGVQPDSSLFRHAHWGLISSRVAPRKKLTVSNLYTMRSNLHIMRSNLHVHGSLRLKLHMHMHGSLHMRGSLRSNLHMRGSLQVHQGGGA